jgi:hypothetical protein
MRPRLLSLLGCCSLFVAPLQAWATPRPLPYSYPYMTLPRGKLELEQYVDLVPVRIARELASGDREAVWSLRSVLQTELEIGLTDRLEGALYFAFRQTAGTAPALRFDGLKQRLRYRFAEAGDWPVDLGIYLEVAELHNEIEIEEKILLSRRLGPITVDANLWVEQEYYFQDGEMKYLYNPTLGASLELRPSLMVGLEYWARGRFDAVAPVTSPGPEDAAASTDVPDGARHYFGPTVLVQTGEYFLSLGAYLRLDHLDRSIGVGDAFGRTWIRVLAGVGLGRDPRFTGPRSF